MVTWFILADAAFVVSFRPERGNLLSVRTRIAAGRQPIPGSCAPPNDNAGSYEMTNPDIGTLLRVPAQVPTRRVSRVREECVDARLGLGRIEDELGLAIFLRDGVIVVHGDRPVGAPVGQNTKTKNGEISAKNQDRRPQNGEQRGAKDSPQQLPQIGLRGLVHEAELYA